MNDDETDPGPAAPAPAAASVADGERDDAAPGAQGAPHGRLEALRQRLALVQRAWTVDRYESLLKFFLGILPRLLQAERSAIFIVDPATGRLLSTHGTGLEDIEIDAPLEGSIVGRAISSDASIVENDMQASPGYHHEIDATTGFATRSLICAPIRSIAGSRVTGAVEVLNSRRERGFTAEDVRLVEEVGAFLSVALENVIIGKELLELSGALSREVSQLRSSYLGSVPFVAESPAMRAVVDLVAMVSESPVGVAILGENGTGKEVIARMIHERSDRSGGPFVAVNCAAVPESLMESEFFGYERGAFTGAHTSRAGRFEEAHGGTLFLDEIGDLPVSMQPKLLRAIENREGSRLGTNRVVQYDARILSATNRRLDEMVASGEFREDLYYRLFSVEVVLPPLRERREDIVPLALALLEDVCRRYDKVVPGFTTDAFAALEACAWPGNVRQLRREIERAVALSTPGQPIDGLSGEVVAAAPDRSLGADDGLDLPARTLALERHLIARALERTGGNKAGAAALLNITRQGLHKKLKRYAAG